jgi:DNA repair protein RecO (recombination protein O)
MAEQKVHGIVISEAVMGDKDKRIVLLTREVGKLTVLAKGVLSPKSRFASATQLFCCASYVLTKGRTFYYIKEAELSDSFYELRTDLSALAWAGLMVEAASETAIDGRENQKLLDLLLRGLMAMRRDTSRARLVASTFLWRLTADNGYRPNLTACYLCGCKDEGTETWGFVPEEGGLVCPNCFARRVPDQYLEPDVRYTLQYILSAPEDKVYRFRCEPSLEEKVCDTACRYLQYQTGGRYQSLNFIRDIEKMKNIDSI